MLIYKTEKGSYHLSLDEAFKVSKTVHQVCPIMDSEEYQKVCKILDYNDIKLFLEEELSKAFQDDCNYTPNWFFPDTRGKRLWKKRLLKRGGEIIKMNKNILIWKH